MSARFFLILVVACALFSSLSPQRTLAQRATVQQPVFRRFSVATTVSVPDRGRAFLGGVSRAASGRKSFGPFHPGSALGFSRSHAGASVGVTIHDFEEMDRRLLNQTSIHRNASGNVRLGKNAAFAYRSLMHLPTRSESSNRQRFRPGRGIPSRPFRRNGRFSRTSRAAIRSAKPTENRADYYYSRGLKAESRGANSIARIYFRLAAKRGSDLARVKLTAKNVAVTANGRN